jgi:hypothetical protein
MNNKIPDYKEVLTDALKSLAVEYTEYQIKNMNIRDLERLYKDKKEELSWIQNPAQEGHEEETNRSNF